MGKKPPTTVEVKQILSAGGAGPRAASSLPRLSVGMDGSTGDRPENKTWWEGPKEGPSLLNKCGGFQSAAWFSSVSEALPALTTAMRANHTFDFI